MTWPNACPGLNGVGGGTNVSIVDNLTDAQGNAKLRPRTLAHEIGHGVDLNHAGVLRCTDAADVRVPISATCEKPDNNQSDPLDTMGTSSMDWGRLFSGPRIAALGWTDPQEIETVSATGTTTSRR